MYLYLFFCFLVGVFDSSLPKHANALAILMLNDHIWFRDKITFSCKRISTIYFHSVFSKHLWFTTPRRCTNHEGQAHLCQVTKVTKLKLTPSNMIPIHYLMKWSVISFWYNGILLHLSKLILITRNKTYILSVHALCMIYKCIIYHSILWHLSFCLAYIITVRDMFTLNSHVKVTVFVGL